MAYDAKFLRVPEIIWLGAFPLDAEKYHLPQQCLLPLTAEGERYGTLYLHYKVRILSEVSYIFIILSDKRKTEAMLQRCYLEREVPHWRSDHFNFLISFLI